VERRSRRDGRVYGFDLASGKKVWEYEAASPVTSSPAVAKGKVVVATGTTARSSASDNAKRHHVIGIVPIYSRAQQQILLRIKIARIEDLGRAAISLDRHLPECVARQVVPP
jgi:hypothetical protein